MKKIDYRHIIGNERNYFVFYILIFSFYCVYNLLKWPVSAGDTDLWYHLSGGRYIFEHHNIPQDSFFSFITPSRKWIDYYWLFQALVYKIHEHSGYYGLIYLRAILFIGLMFFVFRYFSRDLYKKKSYLAISVMVSLYALVFLSRYTLIRPHIFSYLLIGIFIYCLEYRRKMSFFLPFLGLLWINLHGIVYPVMLLITLAYLSELAINRIRKRKETDKTELTMIIPLTLVLFTVYCTPHGIRLIGLPLTPTDFASFYIIELQKLSFFYLSSLSFTYFVPSTHTVFVIIFLIACFSFIRVVFMPGRRIAHLILFAGGLFLLMRGRRFAFDFMLLAIPMITDALHSMNCSTAFYKGEKSILPVKIVLLCCLSIVLLSCLQMFFRNPHRFPVSNARLPHGVAVFLQKVNVGGTILNDPDTGGYLQWALYPKYRIFMDMEVPFLFNDNDMNVGMRVFSDHQTFDKVLMQYDPSFISVPLYEKQFQQIIKAYQHFKPICFDDKEALFVNERHYPLIAEEYSLKYVDPFMFSNITVSGLTNNPNLAMILSELERIYHIDPNIGVVNHSLSLIFHRKGDYPKAIIHADLFISEFPESEIGYALKGDSLKELKKFDEALKNYEIASKKAVNNKNLQRAIGRIYFEQKKYQKAYETFVKSNDIYSPAISYRDIYYISYSAAKTNAKREALFFWRYGVQLLPVDDTEWNGKYKELQLILADLQKK